MTSIQSLRQDFAILEQKLDGQRLCYFDSAATTQKPAQVIDVIKTFYENENSNVHRGLHTLSERATTRYEHARQLTADFFHVDGKEIVWTSGATAAINLLASGLSAEFTEHSKVVISPFEHHANIVPWQQACARSGAELLVLPMLEEGKLDLAGSLALLQQHQPDVLAIGHVSNALGNIQPIDALIQCCQQLGITTVVDGAQSLLHLRPNLRELGCDFYVFSGHKALGPTGIGGLYGRYDKLDALPVYQTGGEMIATVTFEETTFRSAPAKFEPGTPNIAGVIAFAAALEYLNQIDSDALFQYEQQLYRKLLAEMEQIPGIAIYGDRHHNAGVISFNYKHEHHYDMATLLNTYGVAVRSGHHCTQPLMKQLNLNGTARVSLAFYNNEEDIAQFISALKSTIELID